MGDRKTRFKELLATPFIVGFITLSVSVAYSASLRCVQCMVTLLFVGPYKSPFSTVASDSSNHRFYNVFGVSSIFCTFWACLMRSKLCLQWGSKELDFSRVAGNVPNCRF